MRMLSVLIEAQTRLSIKIHRRNFNVSTDLQWVRKILALELLISLDVFLDCQKNDRECIYSQEIWL